MIRFSIKNRALRVASNQSGSITPARTATATASILVRTRSFEQTFSRYLGASPDNMLRVAPLYSLLFQQLVDLNSRRLPGPADRPVLVLLDEFARLGRAPVLAAAFSYLAGYGIRLLPVIQSPSQLRALYGPDVTEDKRLIEDPAARARLMERAVERLRSRGEPAPSRDLNEQPRVSERHKAR
jgi:hypothetical protein